jgi:hypothetical protein
LPFFFSQSQSGFSDCPVHSLWGIADKDGKGSPVLALAALAMELAFSSVMALVYSSHFYPNFSLFPLLSFARV